MSETTTGAVEPTKVAEAAQPVQKDGPVEAAKESSNQVVIVEPQNDLTVKFTDAEWKSTEELRGQLSEIAEEVHGSKDARIQIWGVELTGKPTARGSVVLVKFVRARSGDVVAARAMLVSTLKWRQEFKVDEITKEAFDESVFGKVGVISGKDYEGRPVTYNFYGAVDQKVVFADVDKFIRWRVGLMERGIALIDFEKVDSMVQVHDYDGVSILGGRDPNSKAAAGQASKIFADYYPELLHKKFFVSVPAVLTWIFWMFTKALSPATQAKMSVVGSGPATISKELLPIIDKSQLPKRYGGDGDDI